MPLAPADIEHLKHALLQSDRETQKFLEPLLPLEPVQQLLASFLRDPSKSFQDHVWDPTAQQILGRLRASGVAVHDIQAEANSIFHQQMQRQMGMTESTDLKEVEDAKEDGKRKFKRGDFYPAMNAFKKSLAALVQFHKDDYYDHVIPPTEWEEDGLRQRYVTLTTNLAVCAIKLRDAAAIRLHATNALRVDPKNSKALYALTKVNLMEKMYAEARETVKQALEWHPLTDQFAKLEQEINAAEEKELVERAELLALKETKENAEAEDRERRMQAEAERQAWLERIADAVRLPELDDGGQPLQRLHTYFMRIKRKLKVTVDQLHDPDDGEEPLFECSIFDGSTQVELANGARANSKKTAKNEAALQAIKTLWTSKKEQGKLLPEDQEVWAAYQAAVADGRSFVSTASVKPAEPDAQDATSSDLVEEDGVIRLVMHERLLEPVALLHQLAMQRRLRSVDFEIEDVSPHKNDPLFRCTCRVNGDALSVATAPAKKKAKTESARLALNAAVEQGRIVYIRPMQRPGESAAANS